MHTNSKDLRLILLWTTEERSCYSFVSDIVNWNKKKIIKVNNQFHFLARNWIIQLFSQSFHHFVFSDDFVQTTTVIAKPGARVYVKVEINSVKDMKLHITNLFFGIKFIENIIDIVINSMWKQLFKISAPIVNELISDGYFELFDSTFRNFPFEKIIKPYPYTN